MPACSTQMLLLWVSLSVPPVWDKPGEEQVLEYRGPVTETIGRIKALEQQLREAYRRAENRIAAMYATDPLLKPRGEFEDDRDEFLRKRVRFETLAKIRLEETQPLLKRLGRLRRRLFRTSQVQLRFGTYDANARRLPASAAIEVEGLRARYDGVFVVGKTDAALLKTGKDQLRPSVVFGLTAEHSIWLHELTVRDPASGRLWNFRLHDSWHHRYGCLVDVAARRRLNGSPLTPVAAAWPATFVSTDDDRVVLSPSGRYEVRGREVFRTSTGEQVGRWWPMDEQVRNWSWDFLGFAADDQYVFVATWQQDYRANAAAIIVAAVKWSSGRLVAHWRQGVRTSAGRWWVGPSALSPLGTDLALATNMAPYWGIVGVADVAEDEPRTADRLLGVQVRNMLFSADGRRVALIGPKDGAHTLGWLDIDTQRIISIATVDRHRGGPTRLGTIVLIPGTDVLASELWFRDSNGRDRRSVWLYDSELKPLANFAIRCSNTARDENMRVSADGAYLFFRRQGNASERGLAVYHLGYAFSRISSWSEEIVELDIPGKLPKRVEDKPPPAPVELPAMPDWFPGMPQQPGEELRVKERQQEKEEKQPVAVERKPELDVSGYWTVEVWYRGSNTLNALLYIQTLAGADVPGRFYFTGEFRYFADYEGKDERCRYVLGVYDDRAKSIKLLLLPEGVGLPEGGAAVEPEALLSKYGSEVAVYVGKVASDGQEVVNGFYRRLGKHWHRHQWWRAERYKEQ